MFFSGYNFNLATSFASGMSEIEPTRGRSVKFPLTFHSLHFKSGLNKPGLSPSGFGRADDRWSRGCWWSPPRLFRGCPVVSVGRRATLHPDAHAPSGPFGPVQTRLSAAFTARMLCFWDYSDCFQACVTELADLRFSFMMSTDLWSWFFLKTIENSLVGATFLKNFLDRFRLFVEF